MRNDKAKRKPKQRGGHAISRPDSAPLALWRDHLEHLTLAVQVDRGRGACGILECGGRTPRWMEAKIQSGVRPPHSKRTAAGDGEGTVPQVKVELFGVPRWRAGRAEVAV